MEGQVLGSYRLGAELGSGGMGSVHLATLTEPAAGLRAGDRVALKLIHPHLVTKGEFFDRFRREAEIGRQVRHENVVATIDAGEVERGEYTYHFLVMEYVEGLTLRSLLQDLGFVPEALLREIGRQTAAGLAAIHELGIVHRDLKPENVLITADDEVRIMDLGVARLVEESVALTREGQFAGSLAYAAPEQFASAEIGPAVDLYALGVMLYELATGRNPFLRDAAPAILAAHLEFEPEPVGERNPEFSRFFSEVAAQLLAKEPAARFPSTGFLADVLAAGEDSEWWSDRARVLVESSAHRPAIPVRRETGLFGREGEVDQLAAAWARAREGEGNIVLLEGEAGIGKTRLIDALLDSLEGEDAHVLYGSYPPTGGLGGLTEALLEHFGSAGIESALGRYLKESPALASAFAAAVRHESGGDGGGLNDEALQSAFCRLARGMAAEKPLLWIVDDLHFAGSNSRKILLSMARALSAHRVLLLLGTRPGISEEELAHFGRLEHFRRVVIPRLGAREVMRLLREALGSERLADRLGGKIALKSDGVPFFVFEIIRGLRDGRFLEESPDGTWIETRVIEEIEVPSAVRDLIESRLLEIQKPERALLDVAAVQGFEFDSGLAARVLEQRPFAVLQDLSEIERRSGLVRSAGRAYRFDHHQVQEVIYSEMAPALREECHALLAEAMAEREAVADREPGEAAGENACFISSHHLRGSRPAGARPFLTRALDHLEGTYRNEAAIELMDLALSTPGVVSDADRAEVVRRRAGRLDFLGRAEEARAGLEEALALADATEDKRLRAAVRADLGWLHLTRSRLDPAKEELTEALRLYREAGDRREEGRITARLGSLARLLGNYDRAADQLDRALELARETDDRDGEAVALGNLGLVHRARGRHADARECLERSAGVLEELGDRRGVAVTAINLGVVCNVSNRPEEAREHYERALRIAREIGYRNQEAAAVGNLGNVLRVLGRFKEAMECYRSHLALARDLDQKLGEAAALTNLAETLTLFGATHRARELLLACRALTEEIRDRRIQSYALHDLGEAAEQEGNLGEAEFHYGEALALRRELGYRGGIADSLLSLGGVTAEAGRRDEARTLLAEAEALGRELEVPRVTVLAACWTAWLEGSGVAAAAAMLAARSDRLALFDRLRAHDLLWRTTGAAEHLGGARRLLTELEDETPADYRDTLRSAVPLYRRITAGRRTPPT